MEKYYSEEQIVELFKKFKIYEYVLPTPALGFKLDIINFIESSGVSGEHWVKVDKQDDVMNIKADNGVEISILLSEKK